MTIASIHIYRQILPVAGKPYSFSSGALAEMDSTLVKVTLADGTEGWGETCPLGTTYAPAHAKGARAALDVVAPYLIGLEPLPALIHQKMDAHLMGHAYAKAALDIAVHDALARSLNVPVATLLGGALRDRLPSYYAIGIETPEDAARVAKDKIAQGFRRLQIKVGGRDPQEDIAVLHRVAEITVAAGVPLVADANRSWTAAQALTISQGCRDLPIALEQPCNSLAELRQIRGNLCHPVLLDEAVTDLDAMLTILGDGLADGFGFKVTRAGGLAPMMVLRDLCASRRLPHSCDDSWGGDVVAAACLHLAASVRPDQLTAVWLAAPYLTGTQPEDSPIAVTNGEIGLPPGPGLGVLPRLDKLGDPVHVYS